ncbi:MAG: hypothetical protein WBZ32_06540 [Candidatus Acidiferrales bacterium]
MGLSTVKPAGLTGAMPYQLDFDSANRILRAVFGGVVSDEELVQFYLGIGPYLALKEPLAAVIDFTAVTSFEVSPDTIRQLASLPPALKDPAIPRCVIAPASKIFGLARMFELQGQGTRPSFHVVRNEKEAWAILGVVDPHFKPIETK